MLQCCVICPYVASSLCNRRRALLSWGLPQLLSAMNSVASLLLLLEPPTRAIIAQDLIESVCAQTMRRLEESGTVARMEEAHIAAAHTRDNGDDDDDGDGDGTVAASMVNVFACLTRLTTALR